MNKKLTIWSNNPFTTNQKTERQWLHDQLAGHNFRLFEPAENGREGASAEFLAQADVAFGSPDPEAVLKLQNLSWIHLNSAGYTAYDRADLKAALKKRGAILTNSSSVYNEPCAQHLLSMILCLVRRLPTAWRQQENDRSWNFQGLRAKTILLDERQTVLIFGFGAIAERLIELLAPLKMKIIGVRRDVKGDEAVQIITEKEVNAYLPLADHVVNILPENQGTKKYFNAEKFSRIKSGAFFYNIGRGQTVDQQILIKMLKNQNIAAAYLDVTDPEPLPPDHPLWTTPNCFITPHIGGGFTGERRHQLMHFFDNLERFLNHGKMRDVVS